MSGAASSPLDLRNRWPSLPIDQVGEDERTWLGGDSPSLIDVNAYMNIWYVRAHLDSSDEMMAEFDHTRAWAGRLRAIGHGQRTEMTTTEALDLATKAVPETEELHDPNDPCGRKVGDKVEVVPDDYGKVCVRGTIIALSPQHIAIRRQDPAAGEVVVHFPRAGFLVIPV